MSNNTLNLRLNIHFDFEKLRERCNHLLLENLSVKSVEPDFMKFSYSKEVYLPLVEDNIDISIFDYYAEKRWNYYKKDIKIQKDRIELWNKKVKQIFGDMEMKYAYEGVDIQSRTNVSHIMTLLMLRDFNYDLNSPTLEEYEIIKDILGEQDYFNERYENMKIFQKILIKNNKKWKGNIKNMYAKKIQMWWKKKLYNPHTDLGKRFALKQIEFAFDE